MEKTGTELTNELLSKLVENTTGPADPDVATTDENLSVDGMFQQASIPSLARSIFCVQPMSGPTAALFNIRTKTDKTGFELLRREVEVFPSQAISTGLTQEVAQDILAQYGKDARIVIGKLLRGLANDQENTKCLTFLDTESADKGNLNFSGPKNAETTLFELTQKVHEIVTAANIPKFVTYEAFCVLPITAAAAIISLNKYVGGDETEEHDLFLAENGRVKFYLNPDPNATDAYVGLRSSNMSKCAAVFSPYVSNVVEATDANTGEQTYHIYNRFAISASPLHNKVSSPLLFKFTIA
jgi:hypothetical protein